MIICRLGFFIIIIVVTIITYITSIYPKTIDSLQLQKQPTRNYKKLNSNEHETNNSYDIIKHNPSNQLSNQTIVDLVTQSNLPKDLISYKRIPFIQSIDLHRYQLLFDDFKKHQELYYLDTNHPIICCDFVGGGFGNKMRSLLSTLLLAIMTGRTLMFCNSPVMLEYFTYQFPIANINMNYTEMSNTTILIQHRNMILKYGLSYLPDHIRAILRNDFVVIQSLYDYFPSLLSNSWFKNQYGSMIEKAFNNNTNPNLLYYYILSEIIRPSKEIQRKVDQFSDQYFKYENIIGLHIRTGNTTNRQEKYAPFERVKPITLINEAIRIREEITLLKSTAKIFLMTDNPVLKASLSSKYDYFVTFSSSIAHSKYFSIQNQSPEVIDSLVEMYLLSQCRIIIKSSGSSFSDMSKLIGGHIN